MREANLCEEESLERVYVDGLYSLKEVLPVQSAHDTTKSAKIECVAAVNDPATEESAGESAGEDSVHGHELSLQPSKCGSGEVLVGDDSANVALPELYTEQRTDKEEIDAAAVFGKEGREAGPARLSSLCYLIEQWDV